MKGIEFSIRGLQHSTNLFKSVKREEKKWTVNPLIPLQQYALEVDRSKIVQFVSYTWMIIIFKKIKKNAAQSWFKYPKEEMVIYIYICKLNYFVKIVEYLWPIGLSLKFVCKFSQLNRMYTITKQETLGEITYSKIRYFTNMRRLLILHPMWSRKAKNYDLSEGVSRKLHKYINLQARYHALQLAYEHFKFFVIP